MPVLVVADEVGVAGEEFGALVALGQLNAAPFWLPQYLLVSLQRLLLHLDVGLGRHEKLLLVLHFLL